MRNGFADCFRKTEKPSGKTAGSKVLPTVLLSIAQGSHSLFQTELLHKIAQIGKADGLSNFRYTERGVFQKATGILHLQAVALLPQGHTAVFSKKVADMRGAVMKNGR